MANNLDPNKPVTAQMFDDPEDEHEQEAPKKATKRKTKPKEEEVVLEDDQNIIELPSNGKLGYPETISYREILVKDEETLSTATPETYTTVLNKVLKSVLNNCPFYEQMSIHDRDFLLVWLWANNYDPVKELTIKCPECSTKTNHKVDLREIEVHDISEDFIKEFEIELTNGEKCWVRMTTVEDELFAEKYHKKHKDLSIDYILTIASIMTEKVMPFEQKLHWARENMKSRELGIVKRYHSHFKFGINALKDYECPACGEVTQDIIPFQAEDILMPTVQTDFDRLLSANKGLQNKSS